MKMGKDFHLESGIGNLKFSRPDKPIPDKLIHRFKFAFFPHSEYTYTVFYLFMIEYEYRYQGSRRIARYHYEYLQ